MPNGLAGSAQVSYPLQAPSGTAGAPSYSFAASPTTGMYRVGANAIGFSANGVGVLYQDTQTTQLASSGALAWSSGVIGAASDVVLWRDAANVLAQRNGVNAQAFRLYTTYTDASNYERLSVGLVGGVPGMRTEYAGTGSPADLAIVASGAFYFGGSGTNQWVCYGGIIYPLVTGTQAIGYSGGRASSLFLGGNTPAASAPMIDCAQTWNDAGVTFVGAKIAITDTLYAAASKAFSVDFSGTPCFYVQAPYGFAHAEGGLRIGSGAFFAVQARMALGASADGVAVISNSGGGDFGRLCFGGTTSAFPSLSRSGTALVAMLADNSDRTAFYAYDIVVKDAGGFHWDSRGSIGASADGVWCLYNNAGTSFGRLQFGGTSSSFPAIKRNGANLDFVKADDSGYIDLTCHDVISNSVYLSNLVGVGANNTNIGLSLTGFAMNIHNSSASLTLAVTGGANLATFAGTGYLEMYEVTAPAAPGANAGRLYFEDNGAGKTRLMCLFNTGAAQQIAIEP